MNPEQLTVAQTCLKAAHDGSLPFPELVRRLIAAGFESYTVDYRRQTQTYYLTNGESILLDTPPSTGQVAAQFDASEIERMVRWAQSGRADYNYHAFSEKVKAAGCAGYIVSFLGKRVLYFGRTGETLLEPFPT